MVAACAAAGTGAPEPAGIAAADGTPFSPAEAEPVGWEARCWACPGPAGTRGFVVCVADADGWDAEGGNIPVTGVETMDSEAVRLAGSDDGAFGMAAAGPLGVAAFAWDAVTACRWFWTVPSDMAIAAAWAGMGPADACTGCGTGDIPNASTADDGTDALTVDGVCVGCVEPVGCAPFAGPAEPAGAAGEPEDGTPDMAAGAEEPANASTAPLGIEDMDTEPSEDDGIAAECEVEPEDGTPVPMPDAPAMPSGTDAVPEGPDGVCVGCVEPVGCAPLAGPAEPAGAAGEPEDGTPDMAAGAEEPANASTAPLGIEDMDTEPSEDDGIAAAVCMESDTGALD